MAALRVRGAYPGAVSEPVIVCVSSFPGRPPREVPWPDDAPTALHALRAGHQPIASSCAGETVCGRCGVFVEGGGDGLAPPDDVEATILSVLHEEPSARLACRVRRDDVAGVLTLRTNYW